MRRTPTYRRNFEDLDTLVSAPYPRRIRLERLRIPAIAGLGVAVGSTAAASPFAPLAVVGAIWVGVLLITNLELALMAILVLRPILDLWTEGMNVPGIPALLDASGLVAVTLALLGVAYVRLVKIDVSRVPVAIPFLAFFVVATFCPPRQRRPRGVNGFISEAIRAICAVRFDVLRDSAVLRGQNDLSWYSRHRALSRSSGVLEKYSWATPSTCILPWPPE